MIQNAIYTVYGKPGSGKTLFCSYLASFHPIIYSNFQILLNGKKVNNTIRTINDLESIPFHSEKGVIVLDEGGVNNNARRSSSDTALEFGKLAMLGRKKNKNIIQISQLERMSDVYWRELSEASFFMRSWYVSKNRLMFEFDLEKNGHIEGSKFVDLFAWMEKFGYKYDTLESGKIDVITKGGVTIDQLFKDESI